MLEDTFESMEDGEDMEEAAEEEIDKILFDITAGEEICSAKSLAYLFWCLEFMCETPLIELYHKLKMLKALCRFYLLQ